MKTFLFALALAMASAGFVLSVCNLLLDLFVWIRKRREENDDA